MHYKLDTENVPFIRTDFSDQLLWRQIVSAVQMENSDGFFAVLDIIDRTEFEAALPEELIQSLPKANKHSIIFIADDVTLKQNDNPILCVSTDDQGRTFRVIPSEIWSVENNLSLSNMDYSDFLGAINDDGIFRGF
jgi:hypothetical protein